MRTRHLPLFVCLSAMLAAPDSGTDVPPQAGPAFQGRVEIDPDKSTPDWPKRVTAPQGAPNIIVILLDDVGFGATSTFGGVAATPTLDRLAAEGLR